MIQSQTELKVGDNSSASLCYCIKVYKKGFIGNIFLVSIKKIKLKSKIKRGCLFKAILVQVKHKTQRKSGFSINFSNNAVILLNKKNEPLGTRIFGAIGNEMRQKFLLKIVALAYIII